MRALYIVLAALTFTTTMVACETGTESDAGNEPTAPRDALGDASGAAGGSGAVSQRPDAAAPKDAQSNTVSLCTPGQATACECASAGKMTLSGTKVCLESTGVYTQCGCS